MINFNTIRSFTIVTSQKIQCYKVTGRLEGDNLAQETGLAENPAKNMRSFINYDILCRIKLEQHQLRCQ